MVDKTKPVDSTGEKASEELFLRGSEKEGHLRKQSEDAGLKLDDSQEELSLQNIQRGSEQRTHPDKGVEEKGAGTKFDEEVGIKSESSDHVAQAGSTENIVTDKGGENQARQQAEASETGDITGEQGREVGGRENSDQDTRRVLFSSENPDSGQSEALFASEQEPPVTNSGEPAIDIPGTNVTDDVEFINATPDAGDDVQLHINEGAPVLDEQLLATDANPGAELSYQVADGIDIPEGFTLSIDGNWHFDAQDPAYDHLAPGNSVVINVPVVVTDEHGASDTTQIQITVHGTNDAPVAGASVTTSVDEGAATITGQLTSSDLDDGATAIFTVTEGNSTPDGFVLNADGSYSFNPADSSYDHLNAGDSDVLTIPVTVTDENGASDTMQVQITLQGSNDAPTAIIFTGSSVDENATAGTVVANMSTQDVDDGESFNYAIVDDASGLFEVSGDQIVVKDGADIDFENETSHEISVQVTDANGLTYDQTVTISVNNINEAPTDIIFNGDSIYENSAAGTVVATFSSVDEDTAETFSYELTDDSGLFELSGSQVVVKAGADIDFESAESHDISVQVTDSAGNSYTEQLTINVENVNEAPVNVQLDNMQIDEISSDPEPLALGDFGNGVVAQDGATGTGYMMLSEENVHDRFSDNPIHTQSADNLVTVKNIDGEWFYDTNTQYIPFTPEPTDRLVAELDFSNDTATVLSGISDPANQVEGINAGFVDGDFSITVNRWNGSNNAGEFGVSGDHINVMPQVDLTVGTVNASDPENDVLSYSLSDDSDGAFQIDSQTGEISIADVTKVDYEQSQSHEVTVEVSDGMGGVTQQTFSIQLNDVNEAPDLVSDQAIVDEDGRVTLDVLANDSDPDAGDSISLDQVSISSGSGQVSIEDGKLVFEPGEQYDALADGEQTIVEISYTVTDSEGLSSEATASITVTGSNDAPEYQYLSDGQVAVDVGEINNGVVGQDGATGTGYMMLSEENVHDRFSDNPIHSQSADNLVTVKNINGEWFYDTNTQYIPFTPEPGDRLIAELDFSNDNATLLSGVSDPNNQVDGINAGYLSGDISINVNQWAGSNNAGEFGVNGSIINVPNEVQQTSIDETIGNGTPVATVIASDAEGDDLQFTLLDNSDGRFAIDASSGQITVNDASKINYEDAAAHEVNVQISDGNGGVIEQQVTVNVADVNEAPTDINISGNSVDENSTAGTVVASLSTVDDDSGESFSYALNDASGLFEISGDKIVVKAGADIDFETAESHDISVEVTDSAGNTLTENFTINVNDIVENIAPTAVDDVTEGFTPENASLVTELAFESGVPSAMVGSVTTEGDGQVGSAADFSNAKVEASGLSLNGDPGAQTTVSMWIQANPEGSWEMLAASDRYDMVMLNGDIGFNTARGDMFGTDASELADGEWHHVVGVFTNGDVTQNTIHIDGVEQEMSQIQGTPSSASANIDSSSGSLYFGSWGANNSYSFSGSMDEIKVYDGVLSSDEVSSLYELEADNVKWDGGALSTQEDSVLTINPSELLANDTDPDGDVLSISAVQNGDHGSVEIDADGNVVFTPEENYSGEATFSYTVNDGNGGEDSATVTLSVSSVNDLPTIDVVNTITVDEDGSQQFTYSTSDIDSADVTLTGSADNGNVVVNANGTVTFTPDENYFGDDTITLTATDNHGGVTMQEISVTVNPMEDAPDAVDDGSFEPQTATLAAEFNFDAGVPTATVGSVTAESDGQIGDAADFNAAKVEASGLSLNGDPGAQTTVSMWIQANPEGGWEMLAASDHYDMVMLNGDIGFNTARGDMFGTDASELADGEWHHVVGVFTNGDVTQNTIHIDGVEQEMSQIQGTPSSASANIDSSSGSLYFGSWGANDSYRFSGSMDEVKVFDGALSSDEIGMLHDIESANIKWDGTALQTDEDVALVINPDSLLANDTDVDGDVISITSVQDAQHGTVEIDGDGNVVFTPDENYNGEATFSYTIDDGKGNTDTATATLNVESIEDVPSEITMTGGAVDENSVGGTVVATLNTSDGDVAETFSYVLTGDDSGLFEISGDQVIVKEGADIDFESAQSHDITVQVTDSTGNQHSEQLTININDIVENIAPTAIDDTTMTTAFDLPPGGRIISTTDDSVTVTGEIVAEGDALSSVDQWSFNHNGGPLTIDVLTESGDSFIDIDGDSAKDHIDSMMRLYDEDGNLVVVNDDSTQGTADGSTNDFYGHIQDSYIDINDLPAGEYKLAIGSWELTDSEVAADQNDNSDKGRGYNIEQDVGPYQIKISGDVSFEKITEIETDEDSAITVNVLVNDSDSDGDVLTITDPGIATDSEGNVVGTTEVVEVDGVQQIQFTPGELLNAMAEGETEVVTFSYTVDDGNGGTHQANVVVNVTGSNDAITAVVDSDVTANTIVENVAVGSYSGVTLEATDADGDAISYAIEGDVPFSIDANGRVITNAEIDFETTESYTFDVTATSADGTTSTNNFTVNVADIEESTEIRGTWRSETIDGTDGNDVIYGEGGNDRLNAGDGNDVLIGGDGSDTLNGGAGNDTFIQNAGDDNDAFYGGEGDDTVVRGDGDGDIGLAGNFGAANSIETIDAGGNDVVGDWRSQTLDFSETSLENVDEIRGEGGNDRITGTSADDTIIGGDGSDTLNGGAGNDTFIQNAGDDNDAFYGGEGDDTVVRGDGDGDIGLAGNFGAANSIETIDAGGNDVVGDWRSQTLDFSETSLENVDEIRGEGGNDRITGSLGDDAISGGSGNDNLTGGAGDDVLSGGTGNDTATGGEGNDTYVMNPFDGSDYFAGGEGGGWTDAIDISAVAANDPDNPWTIEVDGLQVEYEIAEGALALDPDTAGVISFGDGSELSFEGVERIEW